MLGREGPVLRVQGVVIESVGGQHENQAAHQDPPDPQAEAVAPLGVRGTRTSNNRWARGVCAHGLRSELIWTFTLNRRYSTKWCILRPSWRGVSAATTADSATQ